MTDSWGPFYHVPQYDLRRRGSQFWLYHGSRRFTKVTALSSATIMFYSKGQGPEEYFTHDAAI